MSFVPDGDDDNDNGAASVEVNDSNGMPGSSTSIGKIDRTTNDDMLTPLVESRKKSNAMPLVTNSGQGQRQRSSSPAWEREHACDDDSSSSTSTVRQLVERKVIPPTLHSHWKHDYSFIVAGKR